MEQPPPLTFAQRLFSALRPSISWTVLLAFFASQDRNGEAAVAFFGAAGFALAVALWVAGLLRERAERRGDPLRLSAALLAGACGMMAALILVAQVRYAVAAYQTRGDTELSMAALLRFVRLLTGEGVNSNSLRPGGLADALLFVTCVSALLAVLVHGAGRPMARRSRELLGASLICGLLLVGCGTQIGRKLGIALPVAVLPLLTLSALVFQRLEEGYQEAVATLRRRQAYGLETVD